MTTTQILKSKSLHEGPTKTVGFRAPIELWKKFKSIVYMEGLEIGDVMTAMVRLYISDEKFRAKINSLIEESLARESAP